MSETNIDVDSILDFASRITDHNKREGYLKDACDGDVELQKNLSELVEALLSAGSLLDRDFQLSYSTSSSDKGKEFGALADVSAGSQVLSLIHI